MSAQPIERPDPAAALGHQDAARIVAAQYAGGVSLDQIRQHHEDVSARLLNDAQTPVGRAYAREYADTATSLVTDLRADADAAAGRTPEGKAPMAAGLPDGTPHSDPVLAAKGWQAQRGLYVRRTAEALADREAC